ncbi:epoxide hydrolase [Actinomadura kijaniata]|uniref:Microsomal epoxide hydrolase n=1 Tax=Actinomadura namibiensis TaxID=182080 RepID=A0A7W3LUT6_ACTNM|nr:epoxide hydrolase family protein [Actinomadura namibiensis]MBA8954637.1 microsomal epoxide hydrolase [Actinomadura namibiensis]
MNPFTMRYPQDDLDDLARRLERVRWPDEVADEDGARGVPGDRMRKLVEYWRDGFDWRAAEARFNAFPQFTTEIDGATVYFLHVRSPRPDALPLIITHGWPSSPADFLDVIEPLRADFHLVIPAIPGFGPSAPTRDGGWDVHRVARAWATLMERLGYDRYGAQGGDWGSPVSRLLAAEAPDRVVGVHTNYLGVPAPSDLDALTPDDRERADQINRYLAEPAGYWRMQEHRPQTLAYALADSPGGQLAWITDRIEAWADPDIGVPDDHILTTATLYWLSGTAGSSSRLHHESGSGRRRGPIPCPTPLGVAVFANDLIRPIREVAERAYDVVHWSEFDRGGHFPSLETPDLLTKDIRTFFNSLP